MKILFASSLYPSSVEPRMAPYNRQLVAALSEQASVRVMAPVLTFPGLSVLPGRRLPPKRETVDGVPVSHPRVIYTPSVMIHHHWRMYHYSIARSLLRELDSFRPDYVIGSFIYPDAAALLPHCQRRQVPFAAMVLGSDFRIRKTQPRFRETVMRTLEYADRVICPGQVLKRDMAAAGIEADKIVAFDNGVDHGLFKWRSRAEALDTLATVVTGSEAAQRGAAAIRNGARCVLFTGHLKMVKGADRVIKAFGVLPDKNTVLVVAGHGDMLPALQQEVVRQGLAGRVHFLGNRAHTEIALWMNVADCLCLPSRSEGMPNVVVEALASGLPVVATDVGEVPCLVTDQVNGFVCPQGDGNGETEKRLANGIENTLGRQWDHVAIAAGVADMTWPRAAETILHRLAVN